MICFNVTESDHETIVAVAKKEGRPISNFMRQVTREALQQRGYDLEEDVEGE